MCVNVYANMPIRLQTNQVTNPNLWYGQYIILWTFIFSSDKPFWLIWIDVRLCLTKTVVVLCVRYTYYIHFTYWLLLATVHSFTRLFTFMNRSPIIFAVVTFLHFMAAASSSSTKSSSPTKNLIQQLLCSRQRFLIVEHHCICYFVWPLCSITFELLTNDRDYNQIYPLIVCVRKCLRMCGTQHMNAKGKRNTFLTSSSDWIRI